MKKITRYLKSQVEKDIMSKMVFIGGPRQVGKTTLANGLKEYEKDGYLNWDVAEHRERILRREWPKGKLWIFDEIHKYRSWRTLLKGLYDSQKGEHQFVVTGSARLDLYRHGGDSLQGRYHYLRLHPLSVAELGISTQKELTNIFTLGGFPEPYLRGNATEAKRWSREYRTRLIQEDISSLEHVKDVGNLELLMLRLPDLVGSPLSLNSLREDIQVSHKAVSNWMAILERLYALFRIAPFGSPHIRAVKKEQKHYHFDWTLVEEEGKRFENMVACHLLKWVHWKQDAEGEDVELRYMRDSDGREVDFILTKKNKPILAVECKWKQEDISKSLRYFKAKYPACEAWQISMKGTKDYVNTEGIRVAPALVLLKTLV